ncbi:MAG: FAD-dependent oxidoreductase, partial [Christensenellaceae bacterium]|nr:FAD-dependent oxidoreductase [Christensenellaceae bacterium]
MPKHNDVFDVVVIGAGHAGVEAAFSAARLGSKTAMLTLTKKNIGFMPCNPSIGGPAKSHLVFEIDAMGGLMGRVADECALQIRVLNASKGGAVEAYREQTDKEKYHARMQEIL